jgi:hypothetical protein
MAHITSQQDVAKACLRRALSYARGGRNLFPCGANKRPLTAHGLKDASRDPVEIKAWAKRYPFCEMGLGAAGRRRRCRHRRQKRRQQRLRRLPASRRL